MTHYLQFSRRVAILGLLAAALSGATSPAVAQPAQNSRLMLAGAEAAQAPDFWQRFMRAAGKGATVYIIPTAADDPVKAGEDVAAMIRKLGGKPFVVPLASVDVIKKNNKISPFGKSTELLDSDAWQKELSKGRAFIFTDGDPDRLAKTLLFQETDDGVLLEILRPAIKDGAVIAMIGNSTKVAGSSGFRAPRPLPVMLRNTLQWELDYSFGLNLTPPGWIIDYKATEDGNLPRLIWAQANSSTPFGAGLESKSIVEFTLDRIGISGDSATSFIRLQNPAKSQSSAIVPYELNIFNSGDSLNLKDGSTILAASRKPLATPAQTGPAEMVADAAQPNAFMMQAQRVAEGKAGKSTLIAADWPSAAARQAKAQVFTLERSAATKAASDGTKTSVVELSGTLIRDQFLAFPVYQATENE